MQLHVFGIENGIPGDLAFDDAEVLQILATLTHSGNTCTPKILEAMVLATCSRTEAYLVADGEIESIPISPLNQPGHYHHRGAEALSHFFSVASSLRSAAFGDPRVAGQVARAVQLAKAAGTIGSRLERVTASALRTAKRVRRESGITGNSAIGSLVLMVLQERLVARCRPQRPSQVLLIGGNDSARDILIQLQGSSSRMRPGDPILPVAVTGVFCRDAQQAAAFRSGLGVQVLTAAAARHQLAFVDAVVATNRSSLLRLNRLEPILAARIRPLLFLDAAIVGALDPSAASRDGVEVVSFDRRMLREERIERRKRKTAAMLRARQIVGEEADRCFDWWLGQPIQPLRAEVYAAVETVFGRWRDAQPGPVRQLRIAVHRTLEDAFRGISFV